MREGLIARAGARRGRRRPARRSCAAWRDIFGDRALSGADAAPPAERPAAPARACEPRRPGAACRPSSPTTCCSTIPSGASCRTSSPASAQGCTIDALGFRRERHADRHLKPPEEMARLFAALSRGARAHARDRRALPLLARRARLPVSRGARRCPALTPQQALERLTWEGAATRYPEGVPDKVARDLAPRAAADRRARLRALLPDRERHRPLRPQPGHPLPGPRLGRQLRRLLRARHHLDRSRAQRPAVRALRLPRSAREPPDIDVDFEHERRENVIQWIFDTYGRDHAALCSTVIRYRAKGGAARCRQGARPARGPHQAALVPGLGLEPQRRRARSTPRELNLNLGDRRLRLTLELARELIGAPRHLSQHPGGFVLTAGPARRAGADRAGGDGGPPGHRMGQGRHRRAEVHEGRLPGARHAVAACSARFDLLREHKGIELDLATIPAEDPRTYAMIRKADTLGVFQIESRAQMAMLPRIKPRTFYDLVIEVAIVRPGPIQGDMVHPYLRRREGKEPVDYPEARAGEGARQDARRAAVPGAGDAGRHRMRRLHRRARPTSCAAPWRPSSSPAASAHFRDKLIGGMVARGYAPDFAERTFSAARGLRLLRLSRRATPPPSR